MSHTPGPWTFEESDDCGMPEHGDHCRYIRTDNKFSALMGGTKYYPWTPENIDDWRLIAAAPELLEAAKGLLDDISGEVRDPLNLDLEARPEDDPLIAMKWIKALAQAVAKAERGE